MSIYAKLAQARVDLQKLNIKKTGFNKFTNVKYYELQDLMPHINTVMQKNGLCGVVSFADSATLTIYDDSQSITISSQIAEAPLKGATPIQCLGSMHTYLRRYLWLLALEIVEHDTIENAQPQTDSKYVDQLLACKTMQELIAAWQSVPKNLQKELTKTKDDMKRKIQEATNGTAKN